MRNLGLSNKANIIKTAIKKNAAVVQMSTAARFIQHS